MAVTISRELVGPFEALALQNTHVRAVLVPALGGRVWELEDRLRARSWIWHRPDVPLAWQPLGASYDEVWAGGWEELFPNDAPGLFEGRVLPDHGDWWTARWTVEEASASAGAARVRLRAASRVLGAEYTKTYELTDGVPSLAVSYRVTSLETAPFHFLFKQHLPVRVTPACRLVLPGGRVHAVDPVFSALLPGPGPYDWPHAYDAQTGRGVDLSVVPARSSDAREFVYVTDLPEPWCGVEDRAAAATLRMDFDASRLPYVWLFLSYGGWRDVYTAVLEPCSNIPKDLAEAVRCGRAARLDPGASFETRVAVSLIGVAAEAACG